MKGSESADLFSGQNPPSEGSKSKHKHDKTGSTKLAKSRTPYLHNNQGVYPSPLPECHRFVIESSEGEKPVVTSDERGLKRKRRDQPGHHRELKLTLANG